MFNPTEDDIAVIKGKEIDLLLESIYLDENNIKLYVFHIYLRAKYNKIGRITLRLGNSEEIYYFGNIGYRIYKRYRGNHFAAKACMLLRDLLKNFNVQDEIYLTTNLNNVASHKTCEYLGCTLIGSVQVPKHNKLYVYNEHTKLKYRMPIV